jgi:hypothetical protein
MLKLPVLQKVLELPVLRVLPRTPPSTTSSRDGVVEHLSDDIEFDSILQDIAAFEANQTNVQNNVNNMPNYLIYAVQSAGGFTINNSTVHFHFHK